MWKCLWKSLLSLYYGGWERSTHSILRKHHEFDNTCSAKTHNTSKQKHAASFTDDNGYGWGHKKVKDMRPFVTSLDEDIFLNLPVFRLFACALLPRPPYFGVLNVKLIFFGSFYAHYCYFLEFMSEVKVTESYSIVFGPVKVCMKCKKIWMISYVARDAYACAKVSVNGWKKRQQKLLQRQILKTHKFSSVWNNV